MSLRETSERLFESVLTPFERFLRRTTAGGIVLVATTVTAVAVATWTGREAFDAIWARPLAVSLGESRFSLALSDWVNDGLMALFFLVVGLEIKREILVGELASLRDAALPVVAAIGGMVVPALLYAAFNAGTKHAHGWAIPMATDIAFAVGILVLLGRRIPRNLIVFLTALAIVDDLGAVAVIALFYSPALEPTARLYSVAALALLAAFNLGNIRRPLPYIVVGAALWYFVHESGVHATIAGILLAAALPARGPEPPCERWEHALTPWVTFVVVPVFAFANAGIDLSEVRASEVMASKLAMGVLLGLAAGKFIGISAFSALAVRAGIARLPEGVGWRHLLGAAWLGGIGFTMSLFIAQLAFSDARAVEQAKVGIMLASVLSALCGLVWLAVAAPRRGGELPAAR